MINLNVSGGKFTLSDVSVAIYSCAVLLLPDLPIHPAQHSLQRSQHGLHQPHPRLWCKHKYFHWPVTVKNAETHIRRSSSSKLLSHHEQFLFSSELHCLVFFSTGSVLRVPYFLVCPKFKMQKLISYRDCLCYFFFYFDFNGFLIINRLFVFCLTLKASICWHMFL